MLKYVIGSTGSGKSTTCYKYILNEASKNPDKQYIIIVPEQFTLETQRNLVRESKKKVILNIDILSFMRLAYRIFEELMIKEKLILEDAGKNMVIRRLLSENKNRLSFFKNIRGNSGFNSDLKSFISELMQYGITPDKLKKTAEKCDSDILSAKLKDTALIYEKFVDYKKEKYIAAEQILDVLAEVLLKSRFLDNSVVCFDGFTGFTPTQLKIIDLLFLKAEHMIFNITIPKEEYYVDKIDNFNIFYLSKSTITKINEFAIKRSIEILPPTIADYNEKNTELTFVEQNIFRYNKKTISPSNSVIIRQSRDKKDEVNFLLLEILSMVRDSKKRYRDMAVVVGDIEEYGELITETLSRAGIPCFLDNKKKITDNPFIEYIRSIILVIEENFTIESVMRYLRSGFSNIERRDIDIFENYILKRGIRGYKRYSKIFTGFATDEEEIAEKVREKIVEDFSPIYAVLKDRSSKISDFVLALYNFVKIGNTEKTLSELSERFEEQGYAVKSKEYAQCFKSVMSVLEKMYELLGSEVTTVKEFREILESGFEEEKVGFIPPSLDGVLVGDVERTRLSRIKVLFCLGFNEGLVPKPSNYRGIITDPEKDRLQNLDIELSPTQKEKAFREQFYIYMLFSRPTEKLYVTYSSLSSEGRQLKPSYFVERLKGLFEIYEFKEPKFSLVNEVRKDGGIDFLTRSLKNKSFDKNVADLVNYYEKNKNKKYISLIRGFTSKAHGSKLRENIAKRLYEDLRGSVTRLELFSACPYAHFIRHGLGIKEREEFELKPVDIGNILHNILEMFVRGVLQNGSGFALSKDKLKEISNNSILNILNLREEINSSHRLKYQAERLKRITDRAVSTIVSQVSQGSYLPFAVEEKFAIDGFNGRIDRLDSAISDYLPDGRLLASLDEFKKYKKVEYIRVIDYKSGNKSFEPNRSFYGLDLQLLTYLDYVRKYLKNQESHKNNLIIPSGAYYFHIEDPVIDFGEGEDALLRALRLDGITLDSRIDLTDKSIVTEKLELKPSSESNIIKLKTKKDGNLSSTTRLYSSDEISKLIDNTSTEIEKFKSEILKGEITPSPFSLNDDTGCTYCKYKGICGFDLKVPGYKYRRLKPLDEKEIFRKIKEKVEENVDTDKATGRSSK